MNALASLEEVPLIAVIRAHNADDYLRSVPALVEGGVLAIELTLTTPGTLPALKTLRTQLPPDVLLGVGTVRTVDATLSAIERGADFIVSPHTDPAIVSASAARGVPVFPGALTPTEVNTALVAGATAVKLFPAGATSPQLAAQLRGPFPGLQFLPSGGIGVDDVEPWLRAGALAVCVGGPLVGDTRSSREDIVNRARDYVAVAAAHGRVAK